MWRRARARPGNIAPSRVNLSAADIWFSPTICTKHPLSSDDVDGRTEYRTRANRTDRRRNPSCSRAEGSARCDSRGARPYAFTEHGVAMLSSVLRSQRAVEVNIEIMRAFVRMRQLVADHTELVKRLDDLEQRYDEQFRVVFEAIRALINKESEPSNRIGLRSAQNEHQS